MGDGGVTFRYMAKQEKWRPVHKDSRGLRANFTKAVNAIRYELGRINATDIVIEAGYRQIRNDGWPYSNSPKDHGQVRVSFRRPIGEARDVPLSFFFGGWTEFEQNLYMIALTLKALRAVERYGCAQTGEQYAGWAQLPGRGGTTIAGHEWASVEDAMRFLSKVGDGDVVSVLASDLTAVYRAAAKKAHPDAGGSTELFGRVARAKEFVEKFGKVAA